MSKYSVKYNGLRKRANYEELLDEIHNPKDLIKYPDRRATQALNHPYLNQFRGDFDEMSEQDKALKKAKAMLIAAQGMGTQSNTQGTNTENATNSQGTNTEAPQGSARDLFARGLDQSHSVMSGGDPSDTLQYVSESDVPLMEQGDVVGRGGSNLIDYIPSTIHQDIRRYHDISQTYPDLRYPGADSSGSHQVAEAVGEHIDDVVSGALAQRATVASGEFQEVPAHLRPSAVPYSRIDRHEPPIQEIGSSSPIRRQPERFDISDSSSGAAASSGPSLFPQVEAAQRARTPKHTAEEVTTIRQNLTRQYKMPDFYEKFFTSNEIKQTEHSLKTSEQNARVIRGPHGEKPLFLWGDALLLASQLLNDKRFKDAGIFPSRSNNLTTGQRQLTVWLFNNFNSDLKKALQSPIGEPSTKK